MSKIKIVSGWSNPGGSTTAFINLCNLFNEKGYDCTFYGPHQWHLNKCSGDLLSNCRLNEDDTLIYHFLNIFNKRPPVKNFVLSLHEKDLYPLINKPYQIFDKIHYVSEKQRSWHDIKHPSFVLPNVVNNLLKNEKPKDKIGGVIGSVDNNKQTHRSIQRALDDGCKRVLVYGNITDLNYYNKAVLKYEQRSDVVFMGHCDDKQSMYDSITDVYQDSLSETWGYIKMECEMTGTSFHGTGATDGNFSKLSNNEIIKSWIEELNL